MALEREWCMSSRGPLADAKSDLGRISKRGPAPGPRIGEGIRVLTHLVRHPEAIKHVNYAIRLEHIFDRNQCCPPFFVFQHEVLAIMQPYPELAPFDRSQFEVAIAFFDFLHHVRGAQSCNHVVSEHLQQRLFSGFSKLSTVPAGSLLEAS